MIEKNKRLARKDLIMASETIKDLLKQLRNHKYKRCLAMAKWCNAELETLDYKAATEYTDKDVWRIATSYFTIWHKRWLELADKFKEVK